MKFTVIGTGNMGKALVKGFIEGGVLSPSEITLFDINEASMLDLSNILGTGHASSIIEATSDSDYVLLAVKPQHFDDTLMSFINNLNESTIILSIAAAVSITRIENIVGTSRKIVRIMPNTPAQVGAGVSAICPIRLSDEEVSFVSRLFNTCGEIVLCDEKILDAIGCVSGTGPAYVMLFIEAMADAAVSLGIKREDAIKIAAGTIYGSGKLCLETKLNPAVLKDQVCSPGGTTIRGVMALEENGFRNAVIKSVTAAYDRTIEMS